jgi:hypothetical protein
MKKYSYVLYTISACLLFASCYLLSSCKKNEDTAQQKAMKLITGTWTSTNVTVDGVNKNDLFTGFTLTLSPAVFSSSNGDPVWPVSGTWNFTDGNATAFIRNDGVVVSVNALTETSLTLTLQWDKTTFGGGRTNSVSGQHVFEFSK